MVGDAVLSAKTRVTMARNDQSKGDPKGTTAGNSRHRQVRRRQQEILDAAAEIFRDKGYEATSTQDIAEAVGLLKGSLYYYIDSKEDLLFAIIDEAYKGALETVQVSTAAGGNALEKIRALIDAHVAYFTSNQVKMAVLFRDFRSLSEERQRIIAGEGDFYLEEVRSLIRQGQREGVVADDIDPRLTSIAITGMVNSLSQWYDPAGPSSSEEISDAFARLVVGGLATGTAAAQAAMSTTPRRAPGSSGPASPGRRPSTGKAGAGRRLPKAASNGASGTATTSGTGKMSGNGAAGAGGPSGTGKPAGTGKRSGAAPASTADGAATASAPSDGARRRPTRRTTEPVTRRSGR